ncbi:MAG: hypothetical protein KDI44_01125 [Thiothrix sp.]|nr:hypothetical protein [Thiothrix sp.]HPQ97138.1 hypothetical protein [Thiolinea sp.]
MSTRQDFDTTIRIPVITDLVRPGDPEVIKRIKSGETMEHQQKFELRLKERIAELQAATGQDEYSGLARAHAIRAEHQARTQEQGQNETRGFEQQIDQRRYELIRELSTMLK